MWAWECGREVFIEAYSYELATCTSSLAPRPRPAFRRLQYGKAGRAWYLFSENNKIFQTSRLNVVYYSTSYVLDMCGKLPGILALFAVLGPVCPRTIKPFLLSFLSWHHSREKTYQALSRLSVLQAMESWAGPGNEATRAKLLSNVVQWYYKRVCCITFLLHCIQRPCPILWVYLLTNWTGPGPPLAMSLHCIHVSKPHLLKNAWYWPKPVLGYEWLWITSREVWSIGCSYMKLTFVINGFIVL